MLMILPPRTVQTGLTVYTVRVLVERVLVEVGRCEVLMILPPRTVQTGLTVYTVRVLVEV